MGSGFSKIFTSTATYPVGAHSRINLYQIVPFIYHISIQNQPKSIVNVEWPLIFVCSVNTCVIYENLKVGQQRSENGFYTHEMTQCAKTLEQ